MLRCVNFQGFQRLQKLNLSLARAIKVKLCQAYIGDALAGRVISDFLEVDSVDGAIYPLLAP
jgi:hypothetical protein